MSGAPSIGKQIRITFVCLATVTLLSVLAGSCFLVMDKMKEGKITTGNVSQSSYKNIATVTKSASDDGITDYDYENSLQRASTLSHNQILQNFDKNQMTSVDGDEITQQDEKVRNFKTPAQGRADPSPENILLLIADDLRSELSAFIDPKKRPWLNAHIHTPNLAEMASQGAAFLNAYVQAPQCNPSRTSLLTSRRPKTTGVTNNQIWFRSGKNPDIVTMPQYFRQHNFTTVGLGKVFHLNPRANQDASQSWSSYIHLKDDGIKVENDLWAAIPEDTIKSNPLMDQILTQDAIQVLTQVSYNYHKSGQNFFMAVGYRRPHRPWIFPERFLKYYPLDRVPLPPNPYAPHNMPYQSWLSRVDVKRLMRIEGDWPVNTTVPHNITRTLRRAYYSCVSYIDHEIGLLLRKVKTLGLLKNTVIAVLSDHGYQLGEHGLWGKRTNFEEATHVPLMLRIPGVTDNSKRISDLVELLDLFPTLVELAGLPKLPTCPKLDPLSQDACVEGRSMVPLLSGGKGKNAVFSQFPCDNHNCTPSMGYSVRTNRYRYTEWWHVKDPFGEDPLAQQLFDVIDDPLENYNRAEDPKFSEIKASMAKKLRLL